MDIKRLIIYEDDSLVAIDKPSGLLVIPDRYNREKENLYDLLNKEYNKIYILHRLDKDTSGVILFAKNPDIHRNLSMLWEKGGVEKTYIAIVHGTLLKKEGVIKKPIAPLKKKKGVMVVDFKKGKKSITEYKVIEEYNNKYSLLEIKPKTGRTHQIRVHLASIGHPILGDKIYNRKEATGLEKFEDNSERLHLHSYKIKFYYYVLNKELELSANLPDYIKNIGKNI